MTSQGGRESKSYSTDAVLRPYAILSPWAGVTVTLVLSTCVQPFFYSGSPCEAHVVLRSPLPYTGGLYVFVFTTPHASCPVRLSGDSGVDGLKGFCE